MEGGCADMARRTSLTCRYTCSAFPKNRLPRNLDTTQKTADRTKASESQAGQGYGTGRGKRPFVVSWLCVCGICLSW